MRFLEHVSHSLTEVNERVRQLEDKMEGKINEQAKKTYTMSDKIKACDA